MTKSFETPLPLDSLLRDTLPTYDTEDCFVRKISESSFNSPQDLLLKIVKAHPLWIQNLLLLRDLILQPLGLKTPFANLQTESTNFTFEIGNKFGEFELIALTPNSLVFSFEDGPLTAHICLSLSNHKSEASLSSRAVFHHRMGRVYFLAAKPFHKLVFKGLLNCL